METIVCYRVQSIRSGCSQRLASNKKNPPHRRHTKMEKKTHSSSIHPVLKYSWDITWSSPAQTWSNEVFPGKIIHRVNLSLHGPNFQIYPSFETLQPSTCLKPLLILPLSSLLREPSISYTASALHIIPSIILCTSPYRLNRFSSRLRASAPPLPTSAATSIPVPNVIPYSSENLLGFEWMLFEKIEGVPLSDVWEKMDFDSKVRLTLDISNLLQQQHDLEFS